MKRQALYMSLAISLFASLCPKSYSQKVPEIKTFDAQGAGTASGQGTVARSINIRGEIIGEYYDSKVAVHGFLRISDDQISALDVSGASTGNGQGTFPKGINASGEIAGFYYDAAHLVTRGFIRDSGGVITTFDNGLAVSINSDGVVTGPWGANHLGFVRDRNGNITTFSAGPFGTFPSSINDRAEITGFYVDQSFISHGFLREADGGIVPFNVGPNNLNQTQPTDINAEGSIIGIVSELTTGKTHGFVRSKEGHIKVFDVGPNGTIPTAIDSCGRITGYYVDENKLAQGFVRRAHGRVTTFEVPGAGGPFFGDGTLPQSNNQEGAITGYYTDSIGTYHGFLRLPDRSNSGDACEDDDKEAEQADN